MSESISGFLNVNKPAGMTSHDVVARIRRISRQVHQTKKVGHAGTLDPFATGVLVLCVGAATRLSEYVMNSTKQYRATIHLGISTDTYDVDGTITSQVDSSILTEHNIEQILPQFRGALQQKPPMYSAIKKDGKKLYELARAGQTIELETRPVTIYSLEVVAWDLPYITIDVECSPGTYIRSLAYDIGEMLGVGGHLSMLERRRSGTLAIEESISLDTLINSDNLTQYMRSPGDVLSAWRSIELTDEQSYEIQHGRFIPNDQNLMDDVVMAFTTQGEFLAVLHNRGDFWKPHKVFPVSESS